VKKNSRVEQSRDEAREDRTLPPVAIRREARSILLSKPEARAAVRLLGVLQTILESSIDAMIVRGEKEPRGPLDKARVRMDRAHWQAAENLIKTLTEPKRERKARAEAVNAQS
jgi:hypothetical protein